MVVVHLMFPSMPRMTVLLAGQQHPLILTANSDERKHTNVRAHRTTCWMICFLLPLDETTYPAVCYKRYRVCNKIIGKANVSLYCAEVNSFCNAMRFTQGLMLSGLSSPKEVKGSVNTMTEGLWTAWGLTCTQRNDVPQPIPLSGASMCGKLNTFFPADPVRRTDEFAMGQAQVWGTDPSHVFTPLWQAGI